MNLTPAFIKYPEMPHLAEVPGILDSDSLQVFEKLDGGNSQVRVFNGNLLCGSRANFLRREKNFRFEWFNDFKRWTMSNDSLYRLPENLVVYGEFLAPHTLTYKPEFRNRFFMIDVFDTEKGKFVPYHDAKDALLRTGVEGMLFLSPLAEGRLSVSNLGELATSESPYAEGGREGIVVKDYVQQRFAKLWRTSVNPSKEGMLEEILKTVRSLGVAGVIPSQKGIGYASADGEHPLKRDYYSKRDHSPTKKCVRKKKVISSEGKSRGKIYPTQEEIAAQVYSELCRSGRTEVSFSEITKSIRAITNKI